MPQNLTFDIDTDGVALLRIDVADRPMNVFTTEFAAELRTAVKRIAKDAAIVGAVIASAKPGSFMAEADLKDLAHIYERGLSATEAGALYGNGGTVLRALERCGKPVAVALNGLALGGGYELALACHYRVLVDLPKAVVGLPEVTAGLMPGGGGTQRLPRMIGIVQALPLLLSGRHVAPAEALKLGLVDHLVVPGAELDAARAWVLAHPGFQPPWDVKGYRIPGGAGALAPHAMNTFGTGTAQVRRDTQDNYPAPLHILAAVYEGTQLPMDRALAVENKYFGRLLVSSVARNLMRTMFIHRSAAQKLESRPAGVPKQTLSRLAVLGAGMMGAGIAQVAAAAGIDVVLLDSSVANGEHAKSRIGAAWQRDQAAGRCSAEAIVERLGRITATADAGMLKSCNFIIESVFEDREVKAGLMSDIAQTLKERTDDFVWATNTSTLPITGLAKHWPSPEQVIGMHFFSPVPRMELVELILGQQTSPATLARTLDLVAQLRKTPIVVHDSPGFYTSRIFCAYIDEGMAMLEQGVAPALIENAARQAGFATGPLAVCDEVSLDLQRRVVEQAIADDLPERFLRRHAQGVIQRMNTLGRLGRKSNGGFHDFPAGAQKQLWPELASHYPPLAQQPSVEEVKQRLLNIQALESARCVEEGVVASPADADLGSVLGLGYPTWTGGTLSYIDSVGLAAFVDGCERLADLHGERFRPSAWLRDRVPQGLTFHSPAKAQPVESQQ